MPLPSSGIIVVEKPSSSSVKRINNSTLSIKANNSIHPPQSRTEQQTQIQFIEYYDVHEDQLSQRQQQQKQQSTIVVDASLFHQQQQFQLSGSSGVTIGKKVHTLSASSSSLTSSSSLCATSSALLNKSNLQIHTLKAVPMPQTKQFSQQQQILQNTSHSTTSAATISNPHHNLHQQSQHVQQLNLAASSIHQPTRHHPSQQQPTQTAHMIKVSEEFLEQSGNNHNAGNMMISTTGEVINQQQIFKIVSADGTTGNMIIDATNQNVNSTTTTSKVLLSNLTVLSKQQTSAQSQIIGNSHQQPQTIGQTINFVNAKSLYTASTASGNIASGSKQQKFAVSTANIGNFKSSTIKQTSPLNSQYIQQSNAIGQQKINMTAGNRNIQMLTTTRVQNTPNSNTTSNISSNSNIAVISNNAVPQTMVLQQSQKFISNNTAGSKVSTAALNSGGGNAIKKSTAPGTLRMNNSHTATKLMNNLQTTQSVKTFITQSPNVQLQTQQNVNQITLQHPTTKSGSKSKFVKQYNNAILNSAGAVAIATLPQQQSSNQSNLQIQQQQQHQLQPQTTYINHHKSNSGSTKINKINSRYSQSVNMAAQLPPGTQLHQKSIIQSHQQQQFQTTSSNSNIKFVNAQGTIIQQQQQFQQPQQQSLTSQKINKHHHLLHHQQYQNLQSFDTVDGNNVFHVNANQTAAGGSSTVSSGTSTLPLVTTTATTTGSTLLSDDIMMVNGTQMTDELSARILQSMSQKSFSNQRYHQQQQQNVFQTKTSTPVPTIVNSNNNCNSNGNMLPPPICATQNTTVQTNNSNIILSPREYSLYPTATSSPTVGIATTNQQTTQQQQHTCTIQYNNSATISATASSNITGGSFSSNNYITVSNNNNNMASITAHSSGNSAANGILCANTSSGSPNTVRQAQSVPNSRSQSMERKLHESSMSRKSSEYYKVNNHSSLRGSSHHNNIATATSAVAQTNGSLGMTTGNISSSVSTLMGGTVAAPTLAPSLPISRPTTLTAPALIMEPQAQVIHLQATKTLPGTNSSSNDDDDDISGEEIRPAAVETEDKRLRILHAVLLDHTYVNPMPLELPTSFAVQLTSTSKSSAAASTPTSASSSVMGQSQQWSLGGIGAITATSSGGVTQQSYTIYGSQLTRLNPDIDSYSSLNNNSVLAVGEIDPGEETETAPEAELEDDSVTRCICDLTHDDGYMICCDKCCAWQHVDCMGIDRQNIPDEYLCELCQPRIVDKARARSLQLLKRKEQQQQLMLTTQAQTSSSSGTMGAAGSANSGSVGSLANLSSNDILGVQQRLTASSGAGFSLAGNMSADSAGLKLLAAGGSNFKKTKMLKKVKDGVSAKRTKKAEKLAAAAAGLTVNSKPGRKETKKNTKRKKTGTHDGGSSPVGMTAAEKHAANLRQWIENYELAVTNHYSPELRARLHAISKQPSLLQTILNTENPILKEFSNGGLENRATTVPHAGGKILISNLDIVPNSPICELRGKYMLTTQYKTQNTSMNMNSPPPNNYHLASYKAHKTPGPFIFFYQLPGTEVCTSNQIVPQTTTTTTLNPDGTYTTTTTTLPAQQSPPTFLRGPEICVDTRTYGNEARFVRRSCRPNAEIQHLFEKGTIHLFIVALTDIRASTEITVRHEPHDLLAVENKRSSSMIIQSTSTLCACGLTKDCIFGPPMPQLPPTTKSIAGRKSMAQGGGISGSSGNLTAKQRKANQQNLNRNRSISSSASGDSNMGLTAVNNSTIAMSLNSPNNVNKMSPINKISNNNTIIPLTSSCNSNLSNSSSSSSTLTSIMHDSGVCTSSSSPSVSIPSPTQNMHSPIQQHQLINQQQVTQQLLHNAQLRPTVQLLPHLQQKQIIQSLPTPLVLPSPNISYQQQQQQQKQHTLQQQILQQPTMILQQPFNVVAQSATAINSSQGGSAELEQKTSQAPICVLQKTSAERTPQTQSQHHSVQQINQKITLQEPQQQQIQAKGGQHIPSTLTISSGLLETVSTEATIAAVALQSLNASHSPNTSLTPPSPVCGNVETQLHSPKNQQQQFETGTAAEGISEQLPIHQHSQTLDKKSTSASSTPLNDSPQQLQQPRQLEQPQQHSPQQLYKSPQKINHSQNNVTQTVRKTPSKHGRATSFSEDNEQQHHSEDNSLTSTPTSSTPKEKPKLSREDRKMEAILRAIEKMERNQQKQKQTKRQNSGSLNTTPTSPNKTIEVGENSGGTKRSNNHTGNAGRSKKKRKASSKSGQASGFNNQRKRRQIRLHSQESIEECNQQDHEAITSESDGCNVISSPPIQTNASPMQTNISSSTVSNMAGSITASLSTETTNNVDQAAGLLMAFANPNTSPTKNNHTVEITEQHMQQSPRRSSSQYVISSIEMAASSPPTTPSQVSSACLLIEAAVGPLESNLDSNNLEMHNSEFKYPLQAKTKKHLMNSWLHQSEDNAQENNTSTSPDKASQSMQGNTTSEVHSDVVGVSGGLDSLLQAAMRDITQSQSDQEQPQNLSIAAQKVEEFIQQTEASVCHVETQPQIKHSFEYEPPQQRQRTYAALPTPAVDLTLKTPLTIGPNVTSSETCYNRNLNLPLQVSTCSNNSSVKKRWLRQAISEETHEEFQPAFSMTPSPTTAIVENTFSNSQLQATAIFPPAAVTNYVPNGFTTPLKKRRLLLTDKDDADDNVSQSCGDLCVNSTLSPPPAVQQPQHTLEEPAQQEMEKAQAQDPSTRDMHEDADVDVVKYELTHTQITETQVTLLKTEFQESLQCSRVENDPDLEQEQDVDVTTSMTENVPLFQDQIKMILNQETAAVATKVKYESSETHSQQTELPQPSDFNDQEDDVDILRSPSPGREMIKAEDNLVKIEPEDTSGMEDVKIDVEREESMAADDVVVTQHAENKQDAKYATCKEGEKINSLSLSNFEIKKELEPETGNENDEVEVLKSKNEPEQIKPTEEQTRTEMEEPKPKRIKLEHSQAEQENLICVKGEITKEELHHSAEELSVNREISTLKKDQQKLEAVTLSISKEDEKVPKSESIRNDKTDSPIEENAAMASSASSAFLAVKTFAANLKVADVESVTPPPPHTTTIGVGTAAPIQRNKSLSDDDIQARLHSFHKENILFLQSRNKKTKSSSSLASNASNKFLANNNDHNKSRTSSSSVSYHQHHHNHHHYNEGKEKSDKSIFKHYKSSSATPDGSTKKQKVHKRERTTSSSSSNSHKNQQVTCSASSSNKNSISSSKKLKSLKKSSSGSSNSSNTSLTTSTLAPQSCYPTTSTTVTTANLNCEKKKDKHHKQKVTSASSSIIHNTHTTTFPSIKKRQLNFELELTKDMHMLNSAITGGSKHKRETPRLLSDDLSHSNVKKSRKDSNATQREELRNGSNKSMKLEKHQDKKLSVTVVGSTSSKQSGCNSSASSQPTITIAINTPALNTLPTYSSLEDPKLIPTTTPQVPLTTTTILKEHLRLPHFNNVVSTDCSLASNQQSIQSSLVPVQSQPPTPNQPQNIPNLVNTPCLISSGHSNNLTQLQQPPLPPTSPPAGAASDTLSNQNVNSTSHLPFYNTIYGKLLDNSTQPPSLPTSLTLSSNTTSSPVAAISVPTGTGVLSEYLDTKLKSYSTLGGYVSHSALFGLNKTAVNKDPLTSSAVVSSSIISLGPPTLNTKDSSSEMSAPVSSSSSSSTLSSGSTSNPATVLPMKIHTKTASHDPRLNPHLTAPEPPIQPKRKLSINEYRKRMQQSSNDINCGSLTSTPTTPPSSLEPSSLMGPMTMSLTNKCTLYSPDRLTQSVDSQIQKEIMSTTSVVSSSSSSDSLNSSNSSTSLNDNLLKSSSFVEEDSTKGQFNAAPTLLEKQQESLCARLKSLKEKQGLGTSFIVGSGNRSRFSSFSESVASSEFGLRKDDDDMDIIRNRNISVSSSIGGGDLLDNCLEEISSTSTSMSSSREPSPERSYSSQHSSLTASTTTLTTNTSATSHNNNGQTLTRHLQQHHHHQDNINCDKNELTSLERKRSVDIA